MGTLASSVTRLVRLLLAQDMPTRSRLSVTTSCRSFKASGSFWLVAVPLGASTSRVCRLWVLVRLLGSSLVVTDMDRIEVSNLSRQFLFRQPDVQSPKSVTAARVVKGWNPDLQVEALEKGVGVTSEDFFNDAFWQSKDL